MILALYVALGRRRCRYVARLWSTCARTPSAAVAALLVAMVAIQSGASLAKTLFPLVGAAGATALRLGLAAGMLLVILRPWRTRMSGRSLPDLLVYGAALGGMNLLFYLSLQTLPLAVAVGLEFIGPLGLALAQSRRPVDLFWVVLAFVGMLLLFAQATIQRGIGSSGVLLALGAGACWAIYIAVAKRAAVCGRQASVAYGTMIAAMIAVPFGIGQVGGHLSNPHVLAVAIGVALLTSAIPFSLEMIALERLPTRTFSILTSAEPVIAAAFGAAVLGEHLSARQILGMAAIMASAVSVFGSARDTTSARH